MKKVLLFNLILLLMPIFVGSCVNKVKDSSSNMKDNDYPVQKLDSSQSSHVKLSFQGIAIEGSHSEFETKILEQGYKIAERNDENNVYEGNIEGEKVDIVVYYNSSTKKVYLCRIIIDCGNSYDKARAKFYYFKDLYKEKYEGFALNSDMMDDPDTESFSLVVIEPPVHEGSTVLGMIAFSIDQNNPGYKLYIDYENTETFAS